MSSKIFISDEAANYFKNLLLENKDEIGILVGVKESGCSGFSYYIDFAKDNLENFECFIEKEVPMYIKPDDLKKYLSGMLIDCEIEGLNSVIKFKNPNAENECGCGSSFSLKDSD